MHCDDAVDLDDFVRVCTQVRNAEGDTTDMVIVYQLSNEFEFPIASFHHASEAWLVPDVLKRT